MIPHFKTPKLNYTSPVIFPNYLPRPTQQQNNIILFTHAHTVYSMEIKKLGKLKQGELPESAKKFHENVVYFHLLSPWITMPGPSQHIQDQTNNVFPKSASAHFLALGPESKYTSRQMQQSGGEKNSVPEKEKKKKRFFSTTEELFCNACAARGTHGAN